MASDKQLNANRENARRSTGPRTSAGKASSSGNAITHGLTAQRPVIGSEDPAEFDRLRAGLIDENQPRRIIEVELVDRLAAMLMGLRRIPVFEAAMFDWLAHLESLKNEDDPDPYDAKGVLASHRDLPDLDQSDDPEAGQVRERYRIGRMLEAAMSKGDLLGKLSRYEAHRVKQFERCQKSLNDLIAKRRAIEAKATADADLAKQSEATTEAAATNDENRVTYRDPDDQ